MASLHSTCFSATRLNPSTFVVIEDDKWHESLRIYAKVYEDVVVLIDTGCGGAAREHGVEVKRLREFIETWGVEENCGKPINEEGKKAYVVICTHCHYDHIGAIEQFTGDPKAAIWASAYDKSFITNSKLFPTHSLCRFVGMQTPKYEVTHWAAHGERLVYDSCPSPTVSASGNQAPARIDLGLTLYHSPGHTPDSLCIYDEVERVLFVGDTAYEWAPVLFPIEACIATYKRSLQFLIALTHRLNTQSSTTSSTCRTNMIKGEEKSEVPKCITMASGHVTTNIDAEELLVELYEFLCKVQNGQVQERPCRTFRGEEEVIYERNDGRIGFAGPRKMFKEFIWKRDMDENRIRECCTIL